MSSIYKRFGSIMQKHRRAKKCTIEELANTIGASVGLICNIENAKNDVFKLELLYRLIEYLEIPFADIQSALNPGTLDNITVTTDEKTINFSLKAKNIDNVENVKDAFNEIAVSMLDLIFQFADEKNALSTVTSLILQQLRTLKDIRKLE